MDRITPAPLAVARADGQPPARRRHAGCHRSPSDDACIASLMEAIAAGNQAALWAFRDVADPPVRRGLQTALHRLDVRYDRDDLDGMVIDAILAIADVAGAWRPGGAPPWVWAHHRVVGVVHRFIGIFAASLDSLADGDYGDALARLSGPHHAGVSSSGDGMVAVDPAHIVCEARAALAALACDRPDAALLDDALSEFVSARDAALWLAVLDERGAGNRHPAVTVAARFGMRPEAVRKVVQRVGHRLRQAVEGTRFAALASLPILGAHDRDERPAAA